MSRLLLMAHCSYLPKALFRPTVLIAVAAILVIAFATSAMPQSAEEPRDAVKVFNEAQDLHEKNDLAGAISLYQKALAIVPEFPEAEYQKGIAQLALGNLVDAERSLRRAVELRPDWTLALTSLASLLIEDPTRERMDEAEAMLQKVIETDPQNPPALAAIAELRLKANASPAVLADLLARITPLTAKANPTPSLWTARAGLEAALGKRSEAKSSLSSALAAAPQNRNALFQLADLAVIEGDLSRAKSIAAKLETMGPDADMLMLLKANIAAAEGDLDGALKHLDAIKRQSGSSVQLRDRIITSRTTSTADLEKKLESAPGDPGVLGRLCVAYRRDDPARAIEYCRRASEAEPANVTHAVGFGAALVQAKQFDAAVRILRKIVTIAPDNSTARANLATALFQLKQLPEAKAEFVWLTEAQPTAAGAYFFLGVIHDQLNEYLDAAANYQQFLRLADPVTARLDIEKVNLRLPVLLKLVKSQKGRSSSN